MKSLSEMKIAMASDHAGYALKLQLKAWLREQGAEIHDYGCYSSESCDYPDFAHPCAKAVENGEVYPGIAICGTGNGIGMTLNKHQGIRAALCWQPELARLARAHNDANVLVMPARFIAPEVALECVDVFLATEFEGGRHQRRIDKMPIKCKC